MRLLRRGEHGQAAVESALTIPMMVFALLGIVQMSMAHHARILSEHAVFKAARAGSVYRADCGRMKGAALTALAPSMYSDALMKSNDVASVYVKAVEFSRLNLSPKGSPLVWIDYTLENVRPEFDEQLEANDTGVNRLRVKMAYFFEYKIPFVNYIMVRYWLATQTWLSWANKDQTMLVKDANQPIPKKTMDDELLNRARMNAMVLKHYTTPIVTTWTMRMMSDPLASQVSQSGNWKCK